MATTTLLEQPAVPALGRKSLRNFFRPSSALFSPPTSSPSFPLTSPRRQQQRPAPDTPPFSLSLLDRIRRRTSREALRALVPGKRRNSEQPHATTTPPLQGHDAATRSARRLSYVPRHAASDFSRTTSRSGGGGFSHDIYLEWQRLKDEKRTASAKKETAAAAVPAAVRHARGYEGDAAEEEEEATRPLIGQPSPMPSLGFPPPPPSPFYPPSPAPVQQRRCGSDAPCEYTAFLAHAHAREVARQNTIPSQVRGHMQHPAVPPSPHPFNLGRQQQQGLPANAAAATSDSSPVQGSKRPWSAQAFPEAEMLVVLSLGPGRAELQNSSACEEGNGGAATENGAYGTDGGGGPGPSNRRTSVIDRIAGYIRPGQEDTKRQRRNSTLMAGTEPAHFA